MPLGFWPVRLSLTRVLPLARFMATNSSSAWIPVAATTTSPSYSVFSQPIEKSQLDDRDYRLVKLPNDLQALLISDKTADKSAASLDVAVGHLSDPHDIPGCAHFCEHLLFMGTKEFPSENEYSQFISSHGGSTNAYTSAHNTNYYFSVNSGSLAPALHRFSTFFHSPLFSPSCTGREINAVDSEHKKNHQSDTWRLFQLGKHLSSAGHPWRKFGSGNKSSLLAFGREVEALRASTNSGIAAEDLAISDAEALVPSTNGTNSLASTPPENGTSDFEGDGGEAGRETRRRLVEWWSQNYCASRMNLVVLGRENLDELADMAVRLFSPIPNQSLGPVPLITEPTIGPEQRGIIVYAKTIMDFKALEISWSIPWQAPLHDVRPAGFIGHFLGHEGPGSVHSYLKNKGWITYLSAGTSGGAPGFDFFKITIVLTKDGLLHYQDVLDSVYSYLSLLRSSSFQSYHQEEILALSRTSFRFREKQSPSSYVSRLAELSSKPYPKEKLLSAGSVPTAWDEGQVREILKSMNAEDGRVMLMAREDWDAIPLPDGEWLKEPWYGTEHKIAQLPPHIAKKASEPNHIPELFLPGPNAFIPREMEVDRKNIAEPLRRPLKIEDTPLSTLWYKKDDRFWVPKANVHVNIYSPLASMTPRHNLATRLFADLVKDALTEYTYDADLAGLSYNFSNHGEGLQVTVSGYNDKLPVLLKLVLEQVKGLVIRQDRFNVLKEQLRQEYENLSMNQPYHLSDYYGRYLTSQRAWTPDEKLTELALLTAEDIRTHIPELLGRIHIETLVHGNVAKSEAVSILKLIEATLAARSLTPSELISDRALLLPKGCNYIFETPVPNKNDVNSAVTYYFDIGDISDPQTRTVLGLFAHIAHEPAFNQLRTKEQLGYIVSSGMWSATGCVGWRVVVQSEKNSVYLENRIDAFFDTLKIMLEGMSEEEFKQKRQGLINKKLEKWKNLGEETSSFWAHINSGYHDFRRREMDAALLETVTKQDVIKMFMERIHPSSTTRSKLSIHLRSQAAPSLKFSVAASKLLLAALKSRGVAVEEEGFHRLSRSEPPVSLVQDFWTKHFQTLPELPSEAAANLLRLIEKLSRVHPSEAEEHAGSIPPGAQFIDNVASFKAGLTMSKAATPVEIFNDLGSKL